VTSSFSWRQVVLQALESVWLRSIRSSKFVLGRKLVADSGTNIARDGWFVKKKSENHSEHSLTCAEEFNICRNRFKLLAARSIISYIVLFQQLRNSQGDHGLD